MTTNTINELEKTKTAFLQKKLGLALKYAESVLSPSHQNLLPHVTIHAKNFIGKIYSTKGRYNGEQQYFLRGLDFLKKIETTQTDENQKADTLAKIETCLAQSEIYLFMNNWEQAYLYATQAEEKSRKINSISGIVQSLIAQGEFFILKNNFSKALDLGNQCLSYLGEIKEPLLEAEVYNFLCKIHIKRQDYNQILNYAKEVMKISQEYGDIEKEIIASSNLGVYYAARLNYKSAIQYFFSSREKSESIHFDRQTAQVLVNLGTIYALLFNPKEALIKYKAVVEKYDKVLTDTTKTILYNNIGNIYFGEKAYQQSKASFSKSLELALEIGYTEMIALALAHLAKINCEEGDYTQALEHADRADELLEDMDGAVNAKSINLLNFAKLAHHSGDFETAIRHLKSGIDIAKKVRNEDNEIACYRLLSEFYKDKKDFENAYHFQTLYAVKQAEYLKTQRNRQILDQEIKYATREKEQQIDALKKENNLQSMLLEKQAEVERANEQLTQANEELKQFAYIASHDLKEPLRMIGSYTQIIYKKFAPQADENSQTYFHYVTDGVTRMNNLLDGLLQYATIGRGQRELKTIQLNDILFICQSNLRLLIEETGTEIIADDLPEVQGISTLLIQLFQNLLANAIKFRKKDIVPKVIIGCEEKEKEYLISVKDNGIGIKPEYKDRIFVIFQRLHARTDYEGTGIGLAVCHKIIHRMGGKIWVKSELGDGATFYFTFPK